MEKPDILKRLFRSFDELEAAMVSARNTLQKNGSLTADIATRMDSYDEMIAKQRKLANELVGDILNNTSNADEMARKVNLINGLSTMIKDDAREILADLVEGPL